MSRHWSPDDEMAPARPARARLRLPAESITGLAIVAAGCVAMAMLLYRLAGPRDLFGS